MIRVSVTCDYCMDSLYATGPRMVSKKIMRKLAAEKGWTVLFRSERQRDVCPRCVGAFIKHEKK